MKRTFEKDRYTPSEVIEALPQLKKLGWKPREIGILYKMGLLDGEYNNSEKKANVTLDYIHELVSIYNKIKQSKIVKL